MLQRWMLGVSYHLKGSDGVSGMRPPNTRRRRTCQCAKLGKEMMARLPTRSIWRSTSRGSRVACRVWLRIT